MATDVLLESGSSKSLGSDFDSPKNCKNCRFSDKFYTRNLSKGANVERHWILYATKAAAYFASAAKLYGSKTAAELVMDCTKNWKHLSERPRSHEVSNAHILNLIKWTEVKE
jgi:hypothetical protein